MKKQFNKKDLNEMNAYLDRNVFGFLTDRDNFYTTNDKSSNISIISFIYTDMIIC